MEYFKSTRWACLMQVRWSAIFIYIIIEQINELTKDSHSY